MEFVVCSPSGHQSERVPDGAAVEMTCGKDRDTWQLPHVILIFRESEHMPEDLGALMEEASYTYIGTDAEPRAVTLSLTDK